jgi:hypothetical protein
LALIIRKLFPDCYRTLCVGKKSVRTNTNFRVRLTPFTYFSLACVVTSTKEIRKTILEKIFLRRRKYFLKNRIIFIHIFLEFKLNLFLNFKKSFSI